MPVDSSDNNLNILFFAALILSNHFKKVFDPVVNFWSFIHIIKKRRSVFLKKLFIIV
jgi:hypothetical protein